MPVMRPATSERNLTPSSTEFVIGIGRVDRRGRRRPDAAWAGVQHGRRRGGRGVGRRRSRERAGRRGVTVGVGLGVDVGPGAPPSSMMRLSKLVSQPLVLPSVTEEQAAPQLVTSVARWPTARMTDAVVWPEHAAVTVLESGPPLYASTETSRFGVTKVIGSDVGPAPLKPTLLVVNEP